MQKCFLLLLKHPQILVSPHALFAVGIVKAKSLQSDLQVVLDFTMSLTSLDKPAPPPPPPPLALLDPLTEVRRRRVQKTTSTLVSRVQNRELTSRDKRNSSSQTSGAESTSRGLDCVPYWNSRAADWSKK